METLGYDKGIREDEPPQYSLPNQDCYNSVTVNSVST